MVYIESIKTDQNTVQRWTGRVSVLKTFSVEYLKFKKVNIRPDSGI